MRVALSDRAYNALIDFQIRMRRAAGWREYFDDERRILAALSIKSRRFICHYQRFAGRLAIGCYLAIRSVHKTRASLTEQQQVRTATPTTSPAEA